MTMIPPCDEEENVMDNQNEFDAAEQEMLKQSKEFYSDIASAAVKSALPQISWAKVGATVFGTAIVIGAGAYIGCKLMEGAGNAIGGAIDKVKGGQSNLISSGAIAR